MSAFVQFCPHSKKSTSQVKRINQRIITMSWEKTAADKRARLAASIPQEWRIKTEPTGVSVMDYPKNSRIMSPEELIITETSATDLVHKMSTGGLTSVAVTTAFCKRAALAHQLVSLKNLKWNLDRN